MPTETGTIDLKAQKAGHDDAAKTATNYVTEITSDGIWVTPSDAKPTNGAATSSTTGWHISDVLEYFRKGASYIKLWVTGTIARLRLGLETSSHLILDNNSVEVFTDASTSVADFGSTTRIGKANAAHMTQTGSSVAFSNDTGSSDMLTITTSDGGPKLNFNGGNAEISAAYMTADSSVGEDGLLVLRTVAPASDRLSSIDIIADNEYLEDGATIGVATPYDDINYSRVTLGATAIENGFSNGSLFLGHPEYGSTFLFDNFTTIEFNQGGAVKVAHGTGQNEIWLHSNSAGRAGLYSNMLSAWVAYVDENGERHYPGLAMARTTASGTAKNSAAVSAGSNVNVTVNVTAPTTYTYYSAGIVQISRSGTNASGMVLLGVTMNSATSVTVSYKNTGSATVAANAMTVTVGLVFLGLRSADA